MSHGQHGHFRGGAADGEYAGTQEFPPKGACVMQLYRAPQTGELMRFSIRPEALLLY